jgi:2-phosphoglycerate kinase
VRLKKHISDKTGDLFRTNRENELSEEEWLKKFENVEDVIDGQNKESIAFWNSIISFCNNFCEDNARHIVEGVALLPSLVSQMKNKPSHIVYVGNTNPEHLKSMLDFGRKFPEQDWMIVMNYSEKRIEAMATFVRAMSIYFKSEAEKYGFQYYEIDDLDFQGSIEKICKDIMK